MLCPCPCSYRNKTENFCQVNLYFILAILTLEDKIISSGQTNHVRGKIIWCENRKNTFSDNLVVIWVCLFFCLWRWFFRRWFVCPKSDLNSHLEKQLGNLLVMWEWIYRKKWWILGNFPGKLTMQKERRLQRKSWIKKKVKTTEEIVTVSNSHCLSRRFVVFLCENGYRRIFHDIIFYILLH